MIRLDEISPPEKKRSHYGVLVVLSAATLFGIYAGMASVFVS